MCRNLFESLRNILPSIKNNKVKYMHKCACDFTSIVEKDQTTVSRHLKVLFEADIVDFEKNGRNRIYRIKNEQVREMLLNCGVEKLECCCKEC